MGGVINIIYNNKSNENANASLQYRFDDNGNNDSKEAYISLGNNTEKINYLSNIYLKEIKGNKNVEDIDINTIDEVGFNNILTYILNNNNQLSGSIDYFKQNHTSKIFFGGFVFGNDKKINRMSTTIRHNLLLDSKNTVRQSIVYNLYSKNYGHTEMSGNQSSDITEEIYAKYESAWIKHLEHSIINVGIESSYSQYQSNRVEGGNNDIHSSSLYCQYDWDILKNINVIIGSRLDYYNHEFLINSPRLGFMYHPGDRWKFRGTIGKGFRNPSFMEKYIDWYHEDFNYTVIGNPDLKPESSLGIYGGIEYYHPTFYQMSLSVYQNSFTDLIDDYTISPGLLSYTNFDKATFSGIEILGRWRISENYSYSWGMNFVSNKDETGNTLPNTQPVTTTSRVNYQNNTNSFNISFYYKWIGSYTPQQYNPEGGEYTDGEKVYSYALSNIKFSCIPLDILKLSLNIENLGDYTNITYGPFIGRQYTVEISTSIK